MHRLPVHSAPVTWTPYADLDALLDELLGHWRRILGDDLAGAWIQGSFALGAGDQQSDCDWIVAPARPPTDEQVAALREVHDEIPTRPDHWPHDLEGSYAPLARAGLGRPPRPGVAVQQPRVAGAGVGRPLQPRLHPLDPARARHHADRPATPDFMPPVPPDLLRAEAAAAIPTLMADLATWSTSTPTRGASATPWSPPRRILYTLATAEVASKPGALEWASAPSTPAGDRCWRRCATSAPSAGSRSNRHGPARRTRRGPSRRTPWSGRSGRTTSLRA